jgi:uncharacterized protein (DUF1501 family)
MPTRRDFLRTSTLLALAPSVPGFLVQTAHSAPLARDSRVLVVIQLTGGNDGINTVVPYRDEGYARYRKHLRLPAERLHKINDQVGLHPELRGFAKLLEEGRLAIVQGVGYPNPSRSHFKSMAYWHTARFDEKNDDGKFIPSLVSNPGWLGLALDGTARTRDQAPQALSIGLQTLVPALRGKRVVHASLARLDDLKLAVDGDPARAVLPREGERDVEAFVRRSTLEAYTTAGQLKDLARVKPTGVRYPSSGLAQHLRLVAHLVEAGFGTRVYYVEHNGYDTHYSQLPAHANLLENLGGALWAFLTDLARAGVAERVAVLTFSEFGRRVKENGSYGTDHGTAAPVFMAGAGVQAGLVGKTPSLLDLEGGDLKRGLDFRQIYATILEDWLGLPSRAALGGPFDKLALFS